MGVYGASERFHSSLEAAFRYALGKHSHDCVTISVTSPDGDFTVQYAAPTEADEAVWNVADKPPRKPTDGYDVIAADSRFIAYRPAAGSPEELATAVRDIMEAVGGRHAEADGVKTFTMYRGPPSVGDAVSSLWRKIQEVTA